jgi:hypothetical protein
MTLILTLMRPGEGVWQTVDARLTRGEESVEDFAVKQLSVHRWDGTLLVAYTGRAEVHPSGEPMFDWIRGTLRGENRTTKGDLLHLQERLNRDFSRSRQWEVELTLVAAGVLGVRPEPNAPLQNRRLARWVLTNLTWPNGPTHKPVVRRSFQLEGQWVDEPCCWALGSGQRAIAQSESDIDLLRRTLSYRPNKPIDYLGLLAAVNRRAALRSRGTVSPWCSGTYMPQLGQDLKTQSFSHRGDPESPVPYGLPTVLFGIDLTDSTRRMQLQLRNMKLGLPDPIDSDPNKMVEPRP